MDDSESISSQEESEEESIENSSEVNEPNDEDWGISLNDEKKFWNNKILYIYTYQNYICPKCKRNKLGLNEKKKPNLLNPMYLRYSYKKCRKKFLFKLFHL